MDSNQVTAIILAGGQSSRMGQDKALMTIHGVPLLRQICTLALGCAGSVSVVTPWQERYQDIVPSGCRLIREVPLPGETGSHGPLVGFAQGLAQVETPWVLLLACDLPQLQISEVRRWTTFLAQAAPEVVALLPRHPKGWEPLCGFYRRRCLPQLNKFIASGGRSFQHWLAQQSVQPLPVSDFRQLFNCNTPTDVKQISHD